MTTITAPIAPVVPTHVQRAADRAATDPAAAPAPDALVGSGSGSARLLGGTFGFGVGLSAAVGLSSLTQHSPQAIKIAGTVVGLAALGGMPYLGQKLMGHLTRSTQAEETRAADAKRVDLELEIRTLQVKQQRPGGLSDKDEARIKQLRLDRIKAAEGHRDVNWFGKYALPVLFAAGGAALLATGMAKAAPDDGKGINAMFAAIGGGAGGLIVGGWTGHEAGKLLLSGPHHATLPADDAAKVAEIDAELDRLLATS